MSGATPNDGAPAQVSNLDGHMDCRLGRHSGHHFQLTYLRKTMSTDVSRLIGELDGGVFEEKLSNALSIVAASCLDHESKGRIVLTLDVKPISPSQVFIGHKLAFTRPTKRGSSSEEDTTGTPVHVGPQGALSFFPPDQGTFLDKRGEHTDQVHPYDDKEDS